jgi:acetoin utilization deacetylase AcuC-like enzyme
MKVTLRGFAELTHMLMAVAKEHCHDRLVAVMEGGYNHEALAECAETHIRALMEPGT